MGIIRSGIVLTLSSILFLTLFMGNAFLTLSWSLEYDNIQEKMETVSTQAFETFGFKEVIEENYDLMILYCQINPSFEYNTEEFSISIPCDVVNNGIDEVIKYGAKEIVDDLYYKEYDCDFFSCLKNDDGIFVLVSEKAYNYWNSKFYLMMIASIILFVLIFFASTKKNSAFIIPGVLAILSAIPFKKLDWILRFVPSDGFGEIALAFFTKSYNVFLIMLIIGIALLTFGIALSFLGVSVKISNFLAKIIPHKKKAEMEKKGEVPLDKTEKEEKTFTKEEVKKIVRDEIKKIKKKGKNNNNQKEEEKLI